MVQTGVDMSVAVETHLIQEVVTVILVHGETDRKISLPHLSCCAEHVGDSGVAGYLVHIIVRPSFLLVTEDCERSVNSVRSANAVQAP